MTRKAPSLRVALSLALVLVVTVVPTAFAGKGGSGTGGSGATIAFAPTAVAVGQQYQVNGSGFRANTWVSVGAHYADTTWWNSGQTDGQGRISLTFTATSAGQIYHEAQQMGNNERLRLATSGTLTVTP